MDITWIGSPNFDIYRNKIDRIVIHWFGSENSTLLSTDSWFKREKGTSATYAVEDFSIHQYVLEEHTPYSNGNLSMNRRSITIECSANIKRLSSNETYETVSRLVADICKRRSITISRQNIIKHSEVVATQCPGTVDIDRIIKRAGEINSQPDIPMEDQTFAKYWRELKQYADGKFLCNEPKDLFAYINLILKEKKNESDAKDRKDQAVRDVGLDPNDLRGSLDRMIEEIKKQQVDKRFDATVTYLAELLTKFLSLEIIKETWKKYKNLQEQKNNEQK